MDLHVMFHRNVLENCDLFLFYCPSLVHIQQVEVKAALGA